MNRRVAALEDKSHAAEDGKNIELLLLPKGLI